VPLAELRPYMLIGIGAQSPPSPRSPQVAMSAKPLLRVLEKMQSTWWRVSAWTGLSLCT